MKSVSMMVTNLTSNYDQLGPEDINLAVNIVQDVTRGGHSDNEVYMYLYKSYAISNSMMCTHQ